MFKVPKRVRAKKRVLWTTDDGIKVCEVSGPSIRRQDTSFCLGAHWLTRKYIPKNEVWVEKTTKREDELNTANHEIHEARDMRDHEMRYVTAHDRALEYEKKLRTSKRLSRKKIKWPKKD